VNQNVWFGCFNAVAVEADAGRGQRTYIMVVGLNPGAV